MTSLEGIGFVLHWIVPRNIMSTVWQIATSMGVHSGKYSIFTSTVKGDYVQWVCEGVWGCVAVESINERHVPDVHMN